MELLFASNNPHKLQEVGQILGKKIQVISLNDAGVTAELPETSGTINGNALQKAMRCYELTGINCFADDSGLEITALDGRPGVDSAHYSGSRDSEANIRKVLQEMSGATDRSARFVTVIALVIDGNPHLFEGEVKGMIIDAPVGTEGFGYDPIFVPDGFDITFSQMTAEQKNAISHRKNALDKLSNWINLNIRKA